LEFYSRGFFPEGGIGGPPKRVPNGGPPGFKEIPSGKGFKALTTGLRGTFKPGGKISETTLRILLTSQGI